jgi:hypothetical protein
MIDDRPHTRATMLEASGDFVKPSETNRYCPLRPYEATRAKGRFRVFNNTLGLGGPDRPGNAPTPERRPPFASSNPRPF